MERWRRCAFTPAKRSLSNITCQHQRMGHREKIRRSVTTILQNSWREVAYCTRQVAFRLRTWIHTRSFQPPLSQDSNWCWWCCCDQTSQLRAESHHRCLLWRTHFSPFTCRCSLRNWVWRHSGETESWAIVRWSSMAGFKRANHQKQWPSFSFQQGEHRHLR